MGFAALGHQQVMSPVLAGSERMDERVAAEGSHIAGRSPAPLGSRKLSTASLRPSGCCPAEPCSPERHVRIHPVLVGCTESFLVLSGFFMGFQRTLTPFPYRSATSQTTLAVTHNQRSTVLCRCFLSVACLSVTYSVCHPFIPSLGSQSFDRSFLLHCHGRLRPDSAFRGVSVCCVSGSCGRLDC